MQALAHVATLARLAAFAAALAVLALLGVHPAIDNGGGAARAMGPLPACRYDDILTSPRGLGDWKITLVDTILRVPRSYAPRDLVRVGDLGVPGRGWVRSVMADDLKAMSEAAAAAGNAIGIQSAYRSYADQETVFAGWVARLGRTEALKVSARPGHSEHQLGLTVDVRSDPPVATLLNSWGTTAAGKWMRNHAWEYGFVMSYPKGKSGITCYSYEPWHFRYLGRELAATVHASGLTLRQYLWANFTTTVVPAVTPKPTAKPGVAKTPHPSVSHLPTATSAPTDTPAAPPTAPTAPPATASVTPAAPSDAPPTAPATLPPPTAVDDGDALAQVAPVGAAAAAIALGTIVMGGLLLGRRRGRSGVGL
ncbi:MAG TPA: M15 family metallopeptidase [Candidatus Limnocylindrales bacterium]|nr:M15 family metallopeptidase [Candidatus Limnocylindrales bacterium]